MDEVQVDLLEVKLTAMYQTNGIELGRGSMLYMYLFQAGLKRFTNNTPAIFCRDIEVLPLQTCLTEGTPNGVFVLICYTMIFLSESQDVIQVDYTLRCVYMGETIL